MMGYMDYEKTWGNFDKIFRKKTYPLDNKLVKELFKDLNDRLSPENLHEDGEISAYKASLKEADLMKKWRKLEKKVGQKVEFSY